jgi:hypothetical protein
MAPTAPHEDRLPVPNILRMSGTPDQHEKQARLFNGTANGHEILLIIKAGRLVGSTDRTSRLILSKLALRKCVVIAMFRGMPQNRAGPKSQIDLVLGPSHYLRRDAMMAIFRLDSLYR